MYKTHQYSFGMLHNIPELYWY